MPQSTTFNVVTYYIANQAILLAMLIELSPITGVRWQEISLNNIICELNFLLTFIIYPERTGCWMHKK